MIAQSASETLNHENVSPAGSKADDIRLLKAVLMAGGIFCLAAGAVQFLFPGVDAVLAGVQPGELDWIYRLLGSAYIGLGVGMLMVFRNPIGQGVFVSTLILIAGLVCLTFLITLLTANYQPIPMVLGGWIVAFALLVFARQKAKDVL